MRPVNPQGLTTSLLQALWHDANQDWHSAHQIVQEINTQDASWIHAYLHRKEGDRSNAQYWYRQAGREFPTESLSEEWQTITRHLLENL
ncbi:MAG: hypothetical protein ORN54_05530 [Cyclobacteriaceae bacterium]|nr:hypothetical protein [Cyclobacteriaceae bacterium]